MLKVNWDAGRDYIDNFVPFVAECLRAAPQPEVSLPELQGAISDTFDLKIPQGALSTILKRAVKRGYVERIQRIYRRNDDALASLDFSRVRNDVLRKYEALIDKLIEFSNTRFAVEWSVEQADAALLADLEEGSLPILAAAVDNELIPPPDQSIAGADFIIPSFCAEMCERDPAGFDFLETIVKGSMLANVLLFPDLGAVERRFDRVEVYFDTSFVLQALGLEGEARQAPRRELIDLLYQDNATLRIFEHTLHEIRGILDAAALSLRSRQGLRYGYGRTVQYLIDAGYSASDVELAIARLEKSLRTLHIEVKPRPAYTLPLGIDEAKLRSILQEHVGYHREDALTHDVDSLTAVHRLRKGHSYPHIESCNAIFITTNQSLGRGSARFFREEYEDYRDSAVPHCLLDHVFTTMVWLKNPLRAPDLPRKRIIADCYAALNPPDTLWRQYLEEIDRLQKRGDISEDDYYLLRLSLTARNTLMDLTLGGTKAFTEGTLGDVLEAAQAAARAETEATLRAEMAAKQAAEHRAADAERSAAEAVERSATDAQRKVAEAEARLEAQRQGHLDRIRTVAARVGRWVALALQCMGAALAALVVFLGLFFPNLPGGWWTPIVPAVLVAVGLLKVANLTFGVTLTSATRRVEVAVSRFVERTLLRLTLP